MPRRAKSNRSSRDTSNLLIDVAWNQFLLRMQIFRADEKLRDVEAERLGHPTVGWRNSLGRCCRGVGVLVLALLELIWSGLLAALLPVLLGCVQIIVFLLIAIPLYLAVGYFLYRMLVVW